jgi:hypothetical protein
MPGVQKQTLCNAWYGGWMDGRMDRRHWLTLHTCKYFVVSSVLFILLSSSELTLQPRFARILSIRHSVCSYVCLYYSGFCDVWFEAVTPHFICIHLMQYIKEVWSNSSFIFQHFPLSGSWFVGSLNLLSLISGIFYKWYLYIFATLCLLHSSCICPKSLTMWKELGRKLING